WLTLRPRNCYVTSKRTQKRAPVPWAVVDIRPRYRSWEWTKDSPPDSGKWRFFFYGAEREDRFAARSRHARVSGNRRQSRLGLGERQRNPQRSGAAAMRRIAPQCRSGVFYTGRAQMHAAIASTDKGPLFYWIVD